MGEGFLKMMVKDSCQMATTEQVGGRGCGQDIELVDFLPCLTLVRLILQPGRDSTNDLVTKRETYHSLPNPLAKAVINSGENRNFTRNET